MEDDGFRSRRLSVLVLMVLSDECEPVSTRPVRLILMPFQVDAARQERRCG